MEQAMRTRDIFVVFANFCVFLCVCPFYNQTSIIIQKSEKVLIV